MLRDAHWLTVRRAIAWGRVLLAGELILFVFLALWQNGVWAEVKVPVSADFVSFYAAGKLTLAGTPELAYDRTAHFLAEQRAAAPGGGYQFFFYPPIFLFLCAALAGLPYLVAYVVFQLVTMAMFVAVMRRVLRAQGWAWIAPLLAFPAVFWNIGVGQNAFLTAALLGGFTLLIDRRPGIAGMLLGMLCYKPHFGLLAPLALAAGGRWRAFLSAAITVTAVVAATIATFGWETWRAYLAAFAGSSDIYQSGTIDFAGMVSVLGGVRLMGGSGNEAILAQAVMAVLMAGVVVFIWRRGATRSVRGASLLTATLLAVPVALLYDELLALVAIGWLVREGRDQGFMPWEKILLFAVYPLTLLTWSIGTAWHAPLGALANLLILILCLRRIWRAQGAARVVSLRARTEGKRAPKPRWMPRRLRSA